MQINIYEAKTQLSALLDKALAGEQVVIARAGKPLVRLVPVANAAASGNGVRMGGLRASQLKLSSDFHGPLTDDELLGT